MQKPKQVSKPVFATVPQMKNYLLKQKMDALGWLARTGEFVAESLAQQMI
jgi:hypothetical protein